MNLTLPCVIHHREPSSTADRYGEYPFTETGVSSAYCDLQQIGATENQLDRDTATSEFKMTLAPAVTLGLWDLIVADGKTLEVIGEPNYARHPWRGGAVDHVSCRVKRTSG